MTVFLPTKSSWGRWVWVKQREIHCLRLSVDIRSWCLYPMKLISANSISNLKEFNRTSTSHLLLTGLICHAIFKKSSKLISKTRQISNVSTSDLCLQKRDIHLHNIDTTTLQTLAVITNWIRTLTLVSLKWLDISLNTISNLRDFNQFFHSEMQITLLSTYVSNQWITFL